MTGKDNKLSEIRWQAESREDLALLSTILQDSILRVSDVSYDRKMHSFTMILNRYAREKGDQKRVRSILRVEGVLALKSRGISRDNPEGLMVLLGADFLPDDEPPGGALTFAFAGGGQLKLKLELIELLLMDVSKIWGTKNVPNHGE